MSASERTHGPILDANILLRAVFGQRVRQILKTYEDEARFYTPDVGYLEAEKYIPVISKDRKFDVDLGIAVLDQIGPVVEQIDRSLHAEHESIAHGRVSGRDRRIGPLSPQHSCSRFRFGLKIRNSSVAASQFGSRTGSRCICKSAKPAHARVMFDC